MKRVSFKVAKAIKEAGYPQDLSVCQKGYWGHCDNIQLFNNNEVDCLDYWQLCCVAPTYLDVWLWLWERGIRIEILPTFAYIRNYNIATQECSNPEESIIMAIECLVENNLLK